MGGIGSDSGTEGNSTVTRHPLSGVGPAVKVPPSWATRSRIPTRPKPRCLVPSETLAAGRSAVANPGGASAGTASVCSPIS